MELKSYNQMRLDFIDFYQKNIDSILSEYNELRKKIMKSKILASIFGFPLFWLIYGLGSIRPIDFNLIVVSVLPLIVFIILMFLTKTTFLDLLLFLVDSEMFLKDKYMDKFLSIFFKSYKWLKKPKTIDTSYIASLGILDFKSMIFDDVIEGEYKDVVVSIYEVIPLSLLSPILILCGLFTSLIFIPAVIMSIEVYKMGLGFKVSIMIFAFFACIPMVIILLLLIVYYIVRVKQEKSRTMIVELAMNKNFKGHTVIYEKQATNISALLQEELGEITLEDKEFDSAYKVYSDDQIESRYVLTTSMMERLLSLRKIFNNYNIRASFKDNKLVLVIKTGRDMFAMGNNFKDSNTNTFQELYDEMISILKIVDELKLNQHIGL